MNRVDWEARQTVKAEIAEANKKARAERSDEEQLERLDEMFGEGNGAAQERARLLKRIAKNKEK